MPDWKNEKNYAFTKDLTSEGWAWEFLRRNPKYKKDYEYVANIQNEETAIYGEIINPYITESPHARFYEPSKNMNESEKSWKLRCIQEGKEPRKYSISVWYGKKWGISGMAGPNSNDPPSFFPPRPYPKLLDWESVENYYECSDEPYTQTQQKEQFSVVVFDLSQPLTYQIIKAGKMLNEHQKVYLENNEKWGNSTKNHKSKWASYLRVLDAKKQNESPKDVSAVIFPDTSNDNSDDWLGSTKVVDYFHQGMRIVKGGYIQILNIEV